MIFPLSPQNNRWSAREIAGFCNRSWLHTMTCINYAAEVCRQMGQNPADHFDIFTEQSRAGRPRKNVSMTDYGAMLLFAEFPSHSPAVQSGRAYFLVRFVKGLPSPSPVPDVTGFLVIVIGPHGRIRFAQSKTPMVRGNVFRHYSDQRVVDCVRCSDVPRLAKKLAELYRLYWAGGDWYKLPAEEMHALPDVVRAARADEFNKQEAA